MTDKDQKPESNPKLRDEVLKRMLKMKPQPHEAKSRLKPKRKPGRHHGESKSD